MVLPDVDLWTDLETSNVCVLVENVNVEKRRNSKQRVILGGYSVRLC